MPFWTVIIPPKLKNYLNRFNQLERGAFIFFQNDSLEIHVENKLSTITNDMINFIKLLCLV